MVGSTWSGSGRAVPWLGRRVLEGRAEKLPLSSLQTLTVTKNCPQL